LTAHSILKPELGIFSKPKSFSQRAIPIKH
jgi:hypothetical protein